MYTLLKVYTFICLNCIFEKSSLFSEILVKNDAKISAMARKGFIAGNNLSRHDFNVIDPIL